MLNEQYVKELKKGYPEDKKAQAVFIDGYPQQVAETLVNARPTISTKQIRSFFDAVNRIYLKYTRRRQSFDEAILDLKLLKSRVADKLSKKTISEEFNNFMALNIDAVKTPEDFKIFTSHLEAVCNYTKGVKPANNNNKPFNGQRNR